MNTQTPLDSGVTLSPARIDAPWRPRHDPATYTFQGIPGIAASRGGRLFALCYTGGSSEMPGNFVAIWCSDDRGDTWCGPVAVIEHPDEDVRCFDATPWLAPDGRLYVFWAQQRSLGEWKISDASTATWFAELLNPDAPSPAEFRWGVPRYLAPGIMMNKPIEGASGAWLLPISVWNLPRCCDNRLPDQAEAGSWIYASDDGGATFSRRGRIWIPPGAALFDEHALARCPDGSLLALVRLKTGIAYSRSVDDGATWSALEPMMIQGPSSRPFLMRLPSGRLLFVYNDSPGDTQKRFRMRAWLSEDAGKTWEPSILLDDRDLVSYADGQMLDDGTLVLIHDWNRCVGGDLLVHRLSECDLMAGRLVSPESRLGMSVHRSRPVAEKN